MDRDSGTSQQDLIKQSKSPPDTPDQALQPWYSILSVKAALFLTPAVITLVLLYLPSSSSDTLRSSISLVTIALPSDSYQVALGNVGASAPRDESDDPLVRREAETGLAAGYLTITAWGWCVGEETNSATCSDNKLFFSLPDDSQDAILNPENYSKLLLRMLSVHVLASIASLIALGLLGWHLWQCRTNPSEPILPGWLQYGPLLAMSILATIAWATDLILLKSFRGKLTSTTIISGSGTTLTGLSVITAWTTLIITAIPSLIRQIRQQREWANNAYYRDDIESGDVEEDVELEDPEDKTDKGKKELAKKKTVKKSNKRGWLSRRREDRSYRSRSDNRRYEEKRSTKQHPPPSSRSRSSRDKYKRDRYHR